MTADIDAAATNIEVLGIAEAVSVGVNPLRDVTAWLRQAEASSANAGATEYLRLFALVALGWMWTRMAAAAAQEKTPRYRETIVLAHFLVRRILPQTRSLATAIKSEHPRVGK